jgi:hypothetical protein
MTTRSYDADPQARGSDGWTSGYDDRAAGWMVFAIAMLAFAGTLNVFDGIVALAKSSFFVADARYVFSDLNTWGWIILVLGVVQLLAALALAGGSQWARWFGIGVAGVNAIAQLGLVQAYPWWALAVFTVDILVIYALAVYGSRARVAL